MFAPKAPEAIYSAIRLIVSALLRGTSLTAGPLFDSERFVAKRPHRIAPTAHATLRATIIVHRYSRTRRKKKFSPPKSDLRP